MLQNNNSVNNVLSNQQSAKHR